MYFPSPEEVTNIHPCRSALIGAATIGAIGAVIGMTAGFVLKYILLVVAAGLIVGGGLGLLMCRVIKPGALNSKSEDEELNRDK
jgi:disulfide bond formation protein DsbB